MHFSSAIIAIAAFVSGISAQSTATGPSPACSAALSKFSTLMQQCSFTAGGSTVDAKQAQCICTDASIATFTSFATECTTFMPAGYSNIVDQLKASCAQLTGKKSGSSAVHFGIAAGAIAAALL
ncbi:hypothetical protein HDU80_011027 [Chytriomyces hyalinus]|nr:hypothetical protein HDU80_011027 [Chytriomyces hyalinus]